MVEARFSCHRESAYTMSVESSRRQRVSPSDVKQILELFYRNLTRRRIAAAVNRSPDTVQRVIREHEAEVRVKGLAQTLQDGGFNEVEELRRRIGEMDQLGLTAENINEAIPILLTCRTLGVDAGRASELVNAAVTLGGSQVPPAAFAQALIRILTRERETGLTIEQIDEHHRALAENVRGLQSVESQLAESIRNLRATSSELDQRIESSRQQLTVLQSQLQSANATAERLRIYMADKAWLLSVGLDTADVNRTRIVLAQLAGVGYNPQLVIESLVRIQNLEERQKQLAKEVSDLQSSVQTLKSQESGLKSTLERLTAEIELTEFELGKKIEESTTRVLESLRVEATTLKEINEFKAYRTMLQEANIKPDNTELIRRILNEVKTRLNDPSELARQLALNNDLEARRNELQEQIDALIRRKAQLGDEIQGLGEQIHNSLTKRDQLLDEIQDLEKRIDQYRTQLNSVKAELGENTHV